MVYIKINNLNFKVGHPSTGTRNQTKIPLAAIYNLEFTRIDNEVSIYINGKLRATNFAYEDLSINARYQFYVEKGKPLELTIVFYYGQKKPSGDVKPWNQARRSFTLHKSGSKRPVASIHDYWGEMETPQHKVMEYTYQLFGDQ